MDFRVPRAMVDGEFLGDDYESTIPFWLGITMAFSSIISFLVSISILTAGDYSRFISGRNGAIVLSISFILFAIFLLNVSIYCFRLCISYSQKGRKHH